ncbi:hypothetical protein [Brasilonema sp. UFV-L1]|uniref:hypothetical protein n=1 Tax=Brasilonema sp. UFV-L1 TaxID=2234130 RepID=UPI002006D98B|nr:hypothetical protein [Brasilonema sp. UFV-L1]
MSLPSDIASLGLTTSDNIAAQESMARRERTFIQVQIDPAMKTRFTNKLEQEGKKITDVLLKWIEDYVNEAQNVDVMDLKHRVEALERLIQERNSVLVGESRA